MDSRTHFCWPTLTRSPVQRAIRLVEHSAEHIPTPPQEPVVPVRFSVMFNPTQGEVFMPTTFFIKPAMGTRRWFWRLRITTKPLRYFLEQESLTRNQPRPLHSAATTGLASPSRMA